MTTDASFASPSMTPSILLTGASGYVGSRLLPSLQADGLEVRCMARRPESLVLPRRDGAPPAEVVAGDVVENRGLDAALEGIDVAYYLIHSMGRGSGPASEFASRDRIAARNFAAATRRAGVGRVIYLGGLGPTGRGASEHLESRREVADILRDDGPAVAHVRAAMVIGAGSASFEMLRALVNRLPAMICPKWVDTRSQPIAIADVISTLNALATRPDAPGEVQIGGADVLTYRAMMKRFAAVVGRRPPLIVPVPVLTPRLSSYWVTLVTPVEHGLVQPLVKGLATEMVVETPPPPGLNDHPLGFEAAVRAALAEA